MKRIDIHSHLLPGLDDGCRDVEESLACARRMVAAGYSHSFVTPHIWPSLPGYDIDTIPDHVQALQAALDEAKIPLHLMPGGELNLHDRTMSIPPERVVTFGLARKYVLIDMWGEALPPYFEATIRWLQGLGLKVILAHPERMSAVQRHPEVADLFADMGILLQGNLQCLSDPPDHPTYRILHKYLTEDRYFFLGSDLHRLESLDCRLEGLKHAIELVGEAKIDQLTREHPRLLMQF